MFELTIKNEFAAAHRLQNYNGACENLHGHNFIVELSVICEKLNETYIAIDFKELKAILKEILNNLDHRYLNDMEFFKNTNPTSEMIAMYIFKETEKRLSSSGCRPSKVSVWESQKAKATYFEM